MIPIKEEWEAEYKAWRERPLENERFIYTLPYAAQRYLSADDRPCRSRSRLDRGRDNPK